MNTSEFTKARIENALRWAAYWEGRGDKDQAQRWKEEAESLLSSQKAGA